MRVLRGFRRPRWLAAVALTAVAAPVIFLVSGVTGTAAPHAADNTGRRPGLHLRPVVRPWRYSDVYRVSGADGPPTDPSSPWNVPSTVNGWQEFFQHWKDQLTDEKVMTKLAKFATVSDHYFRRMPEQRTNPNYAFDPNYRWDSDDAEVTIPGGVCPGERVLISAHPDGTPVSPTIVGEVNNPQNSTSAVFGFGAGRRTLTLSNVANGGAYDDTSGVALTMGEYQALLRWYHANQSYPAKTLKVALLDASAGRAKDGTYLREGAKYYADNLIPKGPQGQYAMFAQMNANGLSYPAYHLGHAVLLEQPRERRRRAVAHLHHRHAGGAERALPGHRPRLAGRQHRGEQRGDLAVRREPPGRRHRPVSRSRASKYDGTVPQENPLRYNHTGSAPLPAVATPFVPAYTASDMATYSPVHPAGTAPEAQESTHEDEASIFWNLGIPGFSVGGVQDSNIDENPYASTVSAAIRSTPIRQYAGGGTAFELASNVPVAGMTTLAAASAVGATNVKVASVTNLIAGQPFFVDTGLNLETGVIAAVGTAGAGGTGVTLAAPLKLAHASGVPFNVNQGQPVGFTGDTVEHLNFFASGAPHGLGRRDVSDRGAAAGARAARDVHGAPRERRRLPRRRRRKPDSDGRVLRDRLRSTRRRR